MATWLTAALRRTLSLGIVLALLTTALSSPAASTETTTIGLAESVAEIQLAADYNYAKDGPVLRLYQAFFAREPDLSGAKYWLNIRRQGFTALQIAAFMSASTEFRNTYGGTSNAEFTERVYTNVLGRDFDQGGYEYWLGLLDRGAAHGGLDRPSMVFYVTDNDEFRRNYPFGSANPLSGTSFGDGIRSVPPGIYVTNNPGACYWARLSGLGGSLEEIIENNIQTGFRQMVLEVEDGDLALETTRCGTFRIASDSPMPSPSSFGGGGWFVGAQIVPGRYISNTPESGCYWQRSSGFSGSLSDIVANDFLGAAEQVVVDVLPTDVGVSFGSGCGNVASLEPAELTELTSIPAGAWIVGSQMPPGVYSTAGPSSNTCFFRRLSSFAGDLDSIITINSTKGPALIEVEASDIGFSTSGCEPWIRTG